MTTEIISDFIIQNSLFVIRPSLTEYLATRENDMNINVREMEESDIAHIVDYFERLSLDTLFCEPYALNPAPNRTLLKLGFEFDGAYETVPGWINFHQKVNRYRMTRERYEQKILS